MPEPPNPRPAAPREPNRGTGVPARLRRTWRSAPRSARRTVWTALITLLVLIASYLAIGPSLVLAANHTVSIVNVSFNPDTLTIAPGDSVTWTNNESDGTVHTVTADDGSYASGNISPGGGFSHTYTAVGTYTYHCSIHSFMTGTITVLQPRELLPTIADVLSKARQEWAIDAEQSGDGAEDKIATRRLVDEAKAVLMDRDGLPEEEAFGFIQRTAMQTRSRMRDVAQQIVDGTLTP